jgi:hypothetical protein
MYLEVILTYCFQVKPTGRFKKKKVFFFHSKMVKISLNVNLNNIQTKKSLLEATMSQSFLDMLEILIFIFIIIAMALKQINHS